MEGEEVCRGLETSPEKNNLRRLEWRGWKFESRELPCPVQPGPPRRNLPPKASREQARSVLRPGQSELRQRTYPIWSPRFTGEASDSAPLNGSAGFPFHGDSQDRSTLAVQFPPQRASVRQASKDSPGVVADRAVVTPMQPPR